LPPDAADKGVQNNLSPKDFNDHKMSLLMQTEKAKLRQLYSTFNRKWECWRPHLDFGGALKTLVTPLDQISS